MSEEQDFTVPENQPYGLRCSEAVIRRLLAFGLKQLAGRVDDQRYNPIDELFRLHSDLVRQEIKQWIRTHPNIPVVLNWPQRDMSLPWVAVIVGDEDEDKNFTMLGDAAGREQYGMLGGERFARQQKAVGLQCVTQVLVASEDPNLTMYLAGLCRFILFSNKLSLHRYYDIRDTSIAARDVLWNENLWPSFAYMRMLELRYGSTFDYNTSPETAKLISLDLMVATETQQGVEVVVSVPDPNTGPEV